MTSSESLSSAAVCSLLKGSILELCKASVPRAEGVEVDAIVCITLGKHTSQQLVIKIHEALWDHQSICQQTSFHSRNTGNTVQRVHENGQKPSIVPGKLLTPHRPNKRKAGCPVAIVNAKQPCLDSEQQDSEGSLDGQLSKDVRKEPEDIDEARNMVKIKTEIQEEVNHSEIVPSKHICIEPSEVYVCEVCKHCFSDNQSYTDHFVLSQKCQTSVNMCSYCHLKFYDIRSYVIHLRSHSTESYGETWKGRPVRCGVCTILLRTKRSISEHMTSSHQHVKCYTCTSCDEIYPDFKTFRLHRNEKHSSVNQCRCEMCELFFTFTEYKDHEKECRIKIYTEDMVARRLPEEYHSPVNSFLESPTDEDRDSIKKEVILPSRSNMTPLCGESNDASESSILDTPTLGPFRCQRCFLVFQEFEQYETHNHEMHSRYVCSYCAQSFATRRNLQRHARRHTGVRPYKCLDCSVTFTRDDDLKKHMFRHNHLTGYKGKSPMRPMLTGIASKDMESGVFQAESTQSSNDSSVIIHQSQEPLYVQVHSAQDNVIPVETVSPYQATETDGHLTRVDDSDISITIDDI